MSRELLVCLHFRESFDEASPYTVLLVHLIKLILELVIYSIPQDQHNQCNPNTLSQLFNTEYYLLLGGTGIHFHGTLVCRLCILCLNDALPVHTLGGIGTR